MASSSFVSSQQVFLLVTIAASLLAVTQAATVVVGGPANWRSGNNYTEWAAKAAPFYFGDALVFKYENSPPHSVSLLPNLKSYTTCDFSNAKLLAKAGQGQGAGFTFVLNEGRVLYFASTEGNDCKDGMKFTIVPWARN